MHESSFKARLSDAEGNGKAAVLHRLLPIVDDAPHARSTVTSRQGAAILLVTSGQLYCWRVVPEGTAEADRAKQPVLALRLPRSRSLAELQTVAALTVPAAADTAAVVKCTSLVSDADVATCRKAAQASDA